MSNKVVLILVIVFLLAVGAIVLIPLISNESGSTEVAVSSNTDEKLIPHLNVTYSPDNDIHPDSWVSGEGFYTESKRTRTIETYDIGEFHKNSLLVSSTDFVSIYSIPARLVSCDPIKKISLWESKSFADIGKLGIKWTKSIIDLCDLDRFHTKSLRSGWSFDCDGEGVILSPANGDVQPITTSDSYYSDMDKKIIIRWYMENGSPGFICFEATTGNVIWNIKLAQKPEFVTYIFDPNIIISGDKLFILEAGFGLYCLDLKTGVVEWRLTCDKLMTKDSYGLGEHLDILDDYLFNDQFCMVNDYAWVQIDFRDSRDSCVYRINTKTLEVSQLQIDNIERIRAIDGKLCCITNTNKLYVVNPKTGRPTGIYKLNDHFSGAEWNPEFYSSHPLSFKIDENEYIFRIDDPENPINLIDKEYWNTWYDREKLKTTGWLGWDCYYYEDENSFTGINTKTGQTTWTIDKSEIRENVDSTSIVTKPDDEMKILIADWRGVLLQYNNMLVMLNGEELE